MRRPEGGAVTALRGVRPAPVPAGVDPADWTSWSWQMQHRIRTAEDLARYVHPVPDEIRAIEQLSDRFHFVITPYYASLMDPDDPDLSRCGARWCPGPSRPSTRRGSRIPSTRWPTRRSRT